MSLVRLVLVAVPLALTIACNGSNSPTPASPSAVPGSTEMAAPAATSAGAATSSTAAPRAGGVVQGPIERLINMMDACEPESFNAAAGPGTCVRNGGMRFDIFIDQLTRNATVGAWRFSPDGADVHEGQTFVVVNRGGEEHTFTEVEEFGGGIIPPLNELAHVPIVAPECAALEEGDDDFVPPGGTYREEVEGSGVEKYQCCIHPWMRLEARVSPK
jgi:hypothetical protein